MRKENSVSKRKVRTLKHGEEKKHFEMLNLCYKPWGDEEEWRKRYLQLPGFDVTKNVVVVEENGEWAGGGTAWFREVVLTNNKKTKVYEAGDLYVHPNFRGKGIYSTAMRSLNELARKRGAALGFAFPSIYGIAAAALPKYDFAEAFRPVTKIFLLNPQRFVDYLIPRIGNATFSSKFDNIKVKLLVFLDAEKKHKVARFFVIKQGQLHTLDDTTKSIEKVDLTIKTNIEMLVKFSSLFYLRKKTLLLKLFLALLRRRLSFRFSWKFVRVLLGLK